MVWLLLRAMIRCRILSKAIPRQLLRDARKLPLSVKVLYSQANFACRHTWCHMLLFILYIRFEFAFVFHFNVDMLAGIPGVLFIIHNPIRAGHSTPLGCQTLFLLSCHTEIKVRPFCVKGCLKLFRKLIRFGDVRHPLFITA